MKALVLAGGLGTRLRPLTHTMAKQLLPVANKPVLHYGLEAIRDAGIREVVMVVGDRGDDVRRSVETGPFFDLRLTYVHQDGPRGIAHGVQIARSHLGEDDFLLYLGDNVILGGLERLIEDFRAHRPDAAILVGRTPHPSRYGVAEVDARGRVTGLEEKPAAPRSDLAVIGAYVFTPAIHQAVRSIRPSWRNELEITDAVAWLAEHGHAVRARAHTGYWKDTGTAEDLLDCNHAVLRGLKPAVLGKVDDDCELLGPVLVEEGARVTGSRVIGPAIIGFDSTVTDSDVGPFVTIGAYCDIMSAGLECSIVLDGASVQGVRPVRDSIIGRQTRVRAAGCSPDPQRLVLGDHSHVVLGR
jgi:glucose-1-phosphate thymidylyltransferase